LEGNCYGLIRALSTYLPGGAAENYENFPDKSLLFYRLVWSNEVSKIA
jgi:hypothetical protein